MIGRQSGIARTKTANDIRSSFIRSILVKRHIQLSNDTIKCIYCRRLYALVEQTLIAEQEGRKEVRCPHCNGKVGSV